VLSLPPPDSYADEAQEPQDAPAAACGLTPVAFGNEEAAGPDSGEDTPECSLPAEVGTQDEKKRQGYRAIEIVEQIHQVQEWLTQGKRPNQIRALCAEHWGLKTRAAEQRMQDARRQMVVDVNTYDRKEMAAKMLQSLETVLNQALEMRQGSNAIGAMRLQADLLQLLSRQN
jgi:hypothetical protein